MDEVVSKVIDDLTMKTFIFLIFVLWIVALVLLLFGYITASMFFCGAVTAFSIDAMAYMWLNENG